MSLKIVSFQAELLNDYIYNGVETDICGQNIKDIASFYASLGTAYIGLIDDKIIGVGGVYKLWKNWGSAWLFLNKDIQAHKICVFKGIINRMNELVKLYGIEILSVQCLDGSSEAHRLLNHLGFVKNKEIKMALYGRKI